jgi:hypothetical protein
MTDCEGLLSNIPDFMVIFLIVISFGLLSYSVYGQENQTSQTNTYENTTEGIRYQYPSYWGNLTDRLGCLKMACVIGFPQIDSQIGFKFMIFKGYSNSSIGTPSCNCNTLMEFVKFAYKDFSLENGFTFINDNQTTVGKKYPAWQIEYSSLDQEGGSTKKLSVLTKVNSTFYIIIFNPFSDYSSAKEVTQFENLINTIEFLPVNGTSPKIPSFLNPNKIEQTMPDTVEDNLDALQILSHNSFTDSIGYFHVVGEVKNNSPTTTIFVKIVGTFYDTNNQVIGTQFTFANPSFIRSGEKASFELILISASVPVSQIDHYNLQASSE